MKKKFWLKELFWLIVSQLTPVYSTRIVCKSCRIDEHDRFISERKAKIYMLRNGILHAYCNAYGRLSDDFPN